MQVIMTKTGELKQVPDGYARNYLFPHKLAIAATEDSVKQAEATQAERAAAQQAKQSEYAALAAKLGKTELKLLLPANAQGKLFAAVRTQEVMRAFQEQSLVVTEEMLTLPNIKHTGDYEVKVKVPAHGGVAVKLEVTAA